MKKSEKTKRQKVKMPMSLGKKIALWILGIAAVCGIVYFTYYYFHFMAYDGYEKYLSNYDYEEGTEFAPIKESKPDVEGMQLVAENDYLKLYTDTATANVAVYDKRSGEITYSNPVNADEDTVANPTNKNYLKSQFILSYYNSDVKSGTFDSYSMAVERGQLEVQSIENGVRYLYTVGDFSSSKTGNLPIYITPEKLNEILALLGEKEATSLQRYYSESEVAPGMLELNGVVQKNVKTIAKVKGWFEGIGWTDEDYEEQMALAGVEVKMPISFLIPLEYRLDEDSLLVSIPTKGIEEYGGGSLYRIQLLRRFGAAHNSEEGYLVVPNGSGSLIRFNNGKTKVANYSQYVYDIDPLAANYTTTENADPVKLALFGICKENSTILATIEDGASLAQITAGISGVYNDYNYAYPSFTLRVADNLVMFGDSIGDVYVLEEEQYDVNLTVRYAFLEKGDKGYVGIANYYRNRLIEEGVLTPNTESGDIPFYYDVIGGVKETAHFLGVQYLRTFAMTTFEEAAQMSNDFAAAGITNQVMNFQGWMNGGYYHDAVHNVRITSKLGGKSGLEDLNATLSANGGILYADASLQNVTYADDGFNYNAEGSRYYGAGYVASFGQVNPTTLRATASLGYHETEWDLLSPKFLPRYVEKYTKAVNKLDLDGLSLRDLGNYLHSDKKRTNVIDREEALDVVLGQWEVLAGTNKALMADAANDYTFKYLTDIINVPVDKNNYFVTDESIPLYQMIIHGCIDYSTELLNFHDEEDMTGIVLNMIEYGASPHYVFTWEESNEMKNTGLNRYYATTYDVWKQEAIDVYNQVNEALKEVSGAQIVDHEIVEEDVRKVTYSNGVTIYINYGTDSVKVDGVEVLAGSYRLEGN
ncbi:MAG: hypothetical protein IJY10_04650 [Lachnospiraceae bacterium]|nr:hypothetical protein [Lachnospiraceae bacterium]